MSEWYKYSGPEGDIAISTRIRVARNIKEIPFPARMNKEHLSVLNSAIKNAVAHISADICGKLSVIEMNNVSVEEAFSMVERHIISPEFAENKADKLLVISSDERVSIMVCEEDHLRIQVIMPGLALEEAYDLANKIDDALAEELSYAYDERFGFLTQCPTNLGTGLRASVMLHLPTIENNGSLAIIGDSATKFGLTVRGLYGEGSKSAASLYQISNQITLGISERSALENLKSIALQIIAKEREDRENISKLAVEDSVMRAYGILKYQRILSSEEMMQLLSKIKLGNAMGILNNVDESLPVQLLIECQPYMLQKKLGIMSPDDRDISRGKIVRERLE